MAVPYGDPKKIIFGAALIYIGEHDADKPDYDANTPYAETVKAAPKWREAGYTQDGVEFSNEPEFTDVQVDQLLSAARTFKTGITNSVNTTFAEATLENLLVVWGQSEGTLTTTGGSSTLNIVAGELGQAPEERKLLVIGNGVEVDGKFNERTYYFERAISVESSSFAQRRDEAQTFPVSFRLLPNNAGSFGTMHERARTWA